MRIFKIITLLACISMVACAAETGTSTGDLGGLDKADSPHGWVPNSILHFSNEGCRANFTALPSFARSVGYSPDHEGRVHDGVALMQMWVDKDLLGNLSPTSKPQVSLLVRMDGFPEAEGAVNYIRDYFAGNFYFRGMQLIDVRADQYTKIEASNGDAVRSECEAAYFNGLVAEGQCEDLFSDSGDTTFVTVTGTVQGLAGFENPGSTWAIELVDEDRFDNNSIALVGMRVAFDVEPVFTDVVEDGDFSQVDGEDFSQVDGDHDFNQSDADFAQLVEAADFTQIANDFFQQTLPSFDEASQFNTSYTQFNQN